MSELEAFITDYMEVRRNMLNHTVEVKLSGGKQWQQLNDTIENSLWRAMQLNDIEVDINRLHILLTSNYAPEYHPLRDYLDRLPPWDGTTDYIGQLAAMVTVKEGQQLFDRCFRKWLVAMIAGALDDEVVNHVILTLVGRQGCYKTSFLQNVLPPQLQQYYTTKSNSQRITKDDLFTLTEYLIVNMEEIDTMPASEFNQLKAIVTQKFVNERPAYGRNKVHRPHVASICATGNVLQYISEDAHRRWATFEVDHIDNPWTAAIPYDGIYAHAYALYKSGFRYWFDEHEVEELNNHVRQFETPHPEHELIMTHYRQPANLEVATYLTASQILTRFGNCGIRLSLSKIGKAMRELGFKSTHTRNGNFWAVVERTTDEVHHFIPSDSEVKDEVNHSESTNNDDTTEIF